MRKILSFFCFFLISLGIIYSQSTTDIPSVWPIQGGIGQIIMFFGNNTNPFTGENFFHNGVDISTFRQGDPIIATADGEVILAEMTYAFGNIVIIKHKHDYATRYCHMYSFIVEVGQQVQQGDIIGYIGSTGLSVGPHLHYEVRLGLESVDPVNYFDIPIN